MTAVVTGISLKGRRLRCPLNPKRIVEVQACWPVYPASEHDRRRFELLLTSGESAYADGSGALLGGWEYENVAPLTGDL